VWPVLKFAARAAAWRATLDPPRAGLSALLGWTLVLALLRTAIQYLDAGPSPAFAPDGINALLAWLAVTLAVAVFFVPAAARTSFLAAMIALSVLIEATLAAIRPGLALLPAWPASDAVLAFLTAAGAPASRWLGPALAISFFLMPVISWIGGMFALIRSVEPDGAWRSLVKAVALWGALFVAKALLPQAATFVSTGAEAREAGWWEYARAIPRREPDVDPDVRLARLQDLQPALLQAEFAHLAPQRKGATDVYALGLAGWSDQDVFAKEVGGAFEALERSLPIKDRTLRLLNNPATVDTVPLASRRNLGAAVHALAAVMDRDEDVLVLFMTSHGGSGGMALRLPGGGSAMLSAPELKATLDGEGIRNRVVIVSACYGGVFVEPLATDNTIVLTAADARSTSFGCAPGRDWTYFGDALFRQSLRPGINFKHAFERARILIRGWEMMDRVPPSNPQGYFGSALVAKLDPLFKSMAGE
jgi:hypothetical protein